MPFQLQWELVPLGILVFGGALVHKTEQGPELPVFASRGVERISLRNIRFDNWPVFEGARGVLCRGPYQGITFELRSAPVDTPQGPPPEDFRPPAGMIPMAARPMTILAETESGEPVKLVEAVVDNGYMKASKNGEMISNVQHYVGHCTSATIILHTDSPLARIDETPSVLRLAVPNLEVPHWPIIDADSTQLPIGDKSKRGIILSQNPELRLMAGRTVPVGFEDIWVCRENRGSIEEIRSDFDRVRVLLSALLGRRVNYGWQDIITERDHRLTRTYWGHRELPRGNGPFGQLVPLQHSRASLDHGLAVITQLPMLYQTLKELECDIDLEWILSPLWTTDHVTPDNMLALSCVSLERLAQAYKRRAKRTGTKSPAGQLLAPDQFEPIKRQLIDALMNTSEIASVDEITAGVLRRKIENMNQTNVDLLVNLFPALGIDVTVDDKRVIKMRDKCLHGNRSLDRQATDEEFVDEMQRVAKLRTLISRAVLSLLKYRGPFIDYARHDVEKGFFVETI